MRMDRGRDDTPDCSALVMACACGGSNLLSGRLGLPVVHVAAVRDADVALRRLNARSHANVTRGRGARRPPLREPGWRDWDVVPMEAQPAAEGAPGVRFRDGFIAVALPAGTTLAEFASSLSGALRHLRVQDAVLHPTYRGDLVRAPVAPARYSAASRAGGRRGLELVTDLYALDPVEHPWRLYWLVVAAQLAVCAPARPAWR